MLATDSSAEIMGFVTRSDLAQVALQGPPTPQHAVFTKRLPLLGRDVQRYAADYCEYLGQFAPKDTAPAALPDPAPRIILDPAFGLVAASVDARHAAMTAQIYRHDIRIISRASAHDRYVALPPEAILLAELHYGGFDRALRAQVSTRLPRLGTVILAVDVPQARIRTLIAEGAAVVHTGHAGAFTGEPAAQHIDERLDPEALIEAVYAFGGIDGVVGNAGMAKAAAFLEEVLSLSPVKP